MTALPLSGTFTMVDPSHVAEVGPAAAILFARIAWRAQHAGEWSATRSQLAAETGLSSAMIRTASDVLREREWVATRRTSSIDSTLIWTPILAGQTERLNPPSRDSETRTDPPAGSAIPSIETEEDYPPTPVGDGSLFDAVSASPALRSVPTAAELDAEFARFWSLYPRRVGKKAARAAYGRARRTASVVQIATGLRAQLPAMLERAEVGELQYVAHPTSWLNQGRWDDDVQTTAAQPAAPAGASYDSAYAATLPPPRTDPFARGVL